jgi:hypothetical protein
VVRRAYSDVFQLADMVVTLASTYPRYVPFADTNNADNAWRYWNSGFVAAAHRMMRGVMLLAEHGQSHEAEVLLRPMLELVGNQAFMARDPKKRAVDFLHQSNAIKQKLAHRAKSYGLATEDEWSEMMLTVESEAAGLNEVVGAPSMEWTRDDRPFARSAKERITEAGLSWHYDLLFFTSSDISHMGAMSVDWIMEFDEGEGTLRKRGVRTEGAAGVVTIATELMLRVLYQAEKVIDEGIEAALNGLATEYWRLNAKKELEVDTLIDHLRGH